MEGADGSPLDADQWLVDVRLGPTTDDPGAARERTGTVRVRYDGGEPVEARVRLELPVPADQEPSWLIPGLFYGENRDAACARIYPRYAPGELDPEKLVSDHWAFRADRAASPVVFGWGDSGGVALAVDPSTSLGLSGLGLAAGPDRPAAIWATLPYREEPFSYTGEPRGVEPLSTTYLWQPGESQELRVGLWELPPDRHGYAFWFVTFPLGETQVQTRHPCCACRPAATFSATARPRGRLGFYRDTGGWRKRGGNRRARCMCTEWLEPFSTIR